ncbi:MAG: TetR/AcrR family transcriptional regulator, tetracycline repressor protein [Subtercola sp.]|nr:TetR/AcrR family transcriptional regulator, tetracycline repressor protein [Subtercola sp.]
MAETSEARTRGKSRERLSRGVLTASALEIADREGLDAVTIRRVASDNSVTPMALYWHFADKEALFDGIAERIYGEVALPDRVTPWDADLHAVLVAVLEALRAHPLVAEMVPSRIMKSEAGLGIAERVIGLLRAARFSPAEAAQSGMFLLCSLVELVAMEPGRDERLDPDARDAMLRGKRAVLESMDPKRFPALLESAEFFLVCPSEDVYFARGIDFLVAGTRGIQPA